MYRVYWDSFLLHDLMIPEEERYYLKNPSLTEEINKVAEFSFDIYSNHPVFDKLEKLVPNIVLEKDNKVIFKGRIIKEKQNMDNSKQVTCESVLAFLLDSIQRPFEFQGTPAELFTQFVNNHNEQVEEYKRFKIGKTTGSNLDNNEYINRSSEEYLNTYEAIESRLLNIGGYLVVRYEDDGNYIDWVDDFAEGNAMYVSDQKIEFGENLIDILVENDASETYTVVIPLGVEFEEVTNEETGEVTPKHRLDIKEVNDGKDYLVNEEALEKYGWIVAPISETTWDDVTVASNLLRKGAEYLNSQAIMMKSTLELNAIDLNVVDKDIDSFRMGEYIEVVSTPHGISKKYLLTKKVTPISKPENMAITLGETEKTFTGLEFEDKNDVEKDVIEKVESTLKDYVTNDKITTIIDEKIENSSVIKQLPDEILLEVSKTYATTEYVEDRIDTTQDIIIETQQELTSMIDQTATGIRSEVSEKYYTKTDTDTLLTEQKTALEQTKDSFEMTFEGMSNDIKDLNDQTNAKFEEYKKYIRFEDGKILLGEVGNQLELTISNDRISFLQSGIEVAYLSNGKLYVTDGEFIHSLRVGKFAFIPRANGSLDFKKVGG